MLPVCRKFTLFCPLFILFTANSFIIVCHDFQFVCAGCLVGFGLELEKIDKVMNEKGGEKEKIFVHGSQLCMTL